MATSTLCNATQYNFESRFGILFFTEHFQFTMSLTNALPEDAAKGAKLASHVLATLPTASRNDALTAIHTALSACKEEILAANARDLELAHKAAENGELSLSIVSRLDLGKKGKWEDMLKGIMDVRELEDPGMSCYPSVDIPCFANMEI